MSQPTTQRKNRLRNREIYAAVKIHLRPQKSVALQYGLSQPRVSQIVKQVSDHLAEFLPGEELAQVFADAGRMRMLDWECQQRRIEQYQRCDLVFEESRHATVEEQWTYDGPADGNQPVKTVLKRKPGKLSLEAVKEQRRLNNELQWGGRRRPAVLKQSGDEHVGFRSAKARPLAEREATLPAKLPLPDCWEESDRQAWDELPREVQELALRRKKLWPEITLHCASVPEGVRWACYPWRTEAEANSAAAAGLVIDGMKTIEEYIMQLEHTELSKPFAHPNVLTKDRDGNWTYIDPDQLPLPVMPPERAALPEESPERIYWPYKSKAEHFAMMRAEMVVRGHLSREQYERLNAWASWFTGDQYPDPLAKIAENISGGESRFLTPSGTGGGEDETTERQRDGGTESGGESEHAREGEASWEGEAPAEPGQRVIAPPPDEPCEEASPSTASAAAPPGAAGPSRREGPTLAEPPLSRHERRLASGRRMTEREARRLMALAAHRQDAPTAGQTSSGT